jgi:hypothetical protein
MTEPFDSLDYKVDSRPARRAWAPGDCIGKCADCRQRYMGAKLSYMCADCCYRGWRPTHRHGPSGDTVVLTDLKVVMQGDSTNETYYVAEAMDGRNVAWNRDKFLAEFARV